MAHHASLPPEPLPLTEASVQEIQLELIRRRRFNEFDGPKIVASLRKHRKLWQAVLMDRLGAPAESGPAPLSLIKLRDLPENRWSVDLLYVLCSSRLAAERLKAAAEEDEWKADEVTIYTDPSFVNSVLGGAMSDQAAVLEMWWD